MKRLSNLFLVWMLSTIGPVAFADENFRLRIDWSQPSTLSETVVQRCDDAYYPAVEVIVPGIPGKDFHVSMATDVTRGYFGAGCKLHRIRKEPGQTTYIFSAQSSCEVRVEKRMDDLRDAPRVAVIQIHDAC